jgi:hypothetical protein
MFTNSFYTFPHLSDIYSSMNGRSEIPEKEELMDSVSHKSIFHHGVLVLAERQTGRGGLYFQAKKSPVLPAPFGMKFFLFIPIRTRRQK